MARVLKGVKSVTDNFCEYEQGGISEIAGLWGAGVVYIPGKRKKGVNSKVKSYHPDTDVACLLTSRYDCSARRGLLRIIVVIISEHSPLPLP